MELKKYLVVGILFLFIGAGILPKVLSEKPTDPNKIYIDDDALYPGQGTEDRPYKYIWQGIQNASDSYLIIVRNFTNNKLIKIMVHTMNKLISQNL